MLAENMALISSLGTNSAAREKVIQDALTEAGRVTRVHGYRYFIILKAGDASISGVMVDNQIFRNLLPNTLGKPGANFLTVSRNLNYFRPGLDITIRMYREGEIDPRVEGVWNTEGTMGPILDKPPPQRREPSRLSG